MHLPYFLSKIEITFIFISFPVPHQQYFKFIYLDPERERERERGLGDGERDLDTRGEISFGLGDALLSLLDLLLLERRSRLLDRTGEIDFERARRLGGVRERRFLTGEIDLLRRLSRENERLRRSPYLRPRSRLLERDLLPLPLGSGEFGRAYLAI